MTRGVYLVRESLLITAIAFLGVGSALFGTSLAFLGIGVALLAGRKRARVTTPVALEPVRPEPGRPVPERVA